MTALTIESLGISKEEAAERVIQKIADALLYDEVGDEDGYTHRVQSQFSREINSALQAKITEAVQSVATAEIEPRIAEMIDGVTLQATNAWGEKVGSPQTFREYLVGRAEAYMTEPVDYEGKGKGEARSSYNWSQRTTRVAYMIHKHLHYEIEQAMKAALASVNSSVAKGLHEATRNAINEVAGKLKVKVEA